MVQLKYFGDDRDYFKYDLITHLLKTLRFRNYIFIPMLTRHRVDGEGQKKPIPGNGRDHNLLKFIETRHSKSLRHWESWLSPLVENYHTVEPVDSTWFTEENRDAYWQKFLPFLSKENSLIFIDPDTGLETGSLAYQKKIGRDKYLLNEELSRLLESMNDSSVLMIYQHLPRNRHHHEKNVLKKMEQARTCHSGSHLCTYRENDLAFLFIAKKKKLYERLFQALKTYLSQVNAPHQTLFDNDGRIVEQERAKDAQRIAAQPTQPSARENANVSREPRKSRKSTDVHPPRQSSNISKSIWTKIWKILIQAKPRSWVLAWVLAYFSLSFSLAIIPKGPIAFVVMILHFFILCSCICMFFIARRIPKWLVTFGDSLYSDEMIPFLKVWKVAARASRGKPIRDSDIQTLETIAKEKGIPFELDKSSKIFRLHQKWLLEKGKKLGPVHTTCRLL